MRWIEALKLWNAKHNPGKWCVARKGSPEYDQVKAIMTGKEEQKEEQKAEKPLSRKAKKEAQKKADDELHAKMVEQARKKIAEEAAERNKAVASKDGKNLTREEVLKMLKKRADAVQRETVDIPAALARGRNKSREKVREFLRKAIKERLEKKAAASEPKAPAPAYEKVPIPKDEQKMEIYRSLARDKKLLADLERELDQQIPERRARNEETIATLKKIIAKTEKIIKKMA